MKMRMKTSRAGKQQANIIQMGKLPSEPRGLMSQPRLAGVVTENPLGTLSFCRQDGGAGEDGDGQMGARVRRSYLNEGVAEVVSHQDHDEDCNRNTKVSNYPAQLKHTGGARGCVSNRTGQKSDMNVAGSVSRLTLPGKNALFLNLRR